MDSIKIKVIIYVYTLAYYTLMIPFKSYLKINNTEVMILLNSLQILNKDKV